MLDENAIAEALGAVHGPDGKTPLPQSGAIGGLTHRDGKVYLSIVVDPAQAGKAEPMRKAAETRAARRRWRHRGDRHADFRAPARRAARAEP